jgi:transposase
MQLERLGALAADLRKLDEYVDAKMEPYRAQQKALEGIPGVGAQTARAVLAEIGADMSVFKDEHHLAAWAGICPGNNESAGKRLSGRTRKGNTHLRTALVEASMAAVRKKGGYLRSKYYRLKTRMGVKRAAVAIAHKILTIAYRILADGTVYTDLGETYLDSLSKTRTSRHLVRRLEALGFRVQIEPTAA